MTPESKIKKLFRETAKKYNLRYINLIETGDDGNPDKIALPPGGRPAFIEFKRESGGELSPEQEAKIFLYRSLGYRVFVVNTKEDARALAWGLTRYSGWDVPDEDYFLPICRRYFPE